MPNHWESSARPLFVKTVFINGSRHAILSQEDPFLHTSNSSFKKQSRPNSSLSFTGSFSLDGSQGQEVKAENKKKFTESEWARPRLAKDLSTDLQNCLINLRLVPTHEEVEKPPKSERALWEGSEEKKWGEDIPVKNFLQSMPRKNWNRSRTAQSYGKKFRQETAVKNELSGFKKISSDYYFTNNLENSNKKNYPISHTFSQIFPDEKNCKETHDLLHTYRINQIQEKNSLSLGNEMSNMKTDADFLPTEKVEKVSENFFNNFYSLDSCELYWNNYLMTKAINNSLTERVIQWLDLTHKKRKKSKGHLETLIDKICANSENKICESHREKNDSKNLKSQNKQPEKKEKKAFSKKENLHNDVVSEVRCEKNISTILSEEKVEGENNQNRGEQKIQQEFKSQAMIARKINPEMSKSVELEESILKTFVNVQDLVFNTSPFDTLLKESFVEFRDNKSCKKRHYFLPRQSKSLNSAEGEDKNKTEMSMTGCDGKIKNGSNTEKQMWSESFDYQIEKNFFELPFKNSNGEISEKSTKTSNSFHNVQNSLNQFSPKEHLHEDVLWLKGSKNAWQSVKDLKRPQLHIFMPILFSKEGTEDSTPDYDKCFSEV